MGQMAAGMGAVNAADSPREYGALTHVQRTGVHGWVWPSTKVMEHREVLHVIEHRTVEMWKGWWKDGAFSDFAAGGI